MEVFIALLSQLSCLPLPSWHQKHTHAHIIYKLQVDSPSTCFLSLLNDVSWREELFETSQCRRTMQRATSNQCTPIRIRRLPCKRSVSSSLQATISHEKKLSTVSRQSPASKESHIRSSAPRSWTNHVCTKVGGFVMSHDFSELLLESKLVRNGRAWLAYRGVRSGLYKGKPLH